jgi:hypothetical protein
MVLEHFLGKEKLAPRANKTVGVTYSSAGRLVGGQKSDQALQIDFCPPTML